MRGASKIDENGDPIMSEETSGATSSAEMCVKALEELLRGNVFLKTIYDIESIKET